MKAAAAVFVILTVVFVSQKKKKKHRQPPPTSIEQTVPQETRPEFGQIEINPEMGAKIANFILKQNPRLDGETIKVETESILKSSEYFSVDPVLITALIRRESNFNPRAVSPSGAQGLGQLLPLTAKSMGVDNPFDIQQNIYGTVKYMKILLDMWQGKDNQTDLALASYKIGPNAVKKYGKVPDLPDVKIYLNDIHQYMNQIR